VWQTKELQEADFGSVAKKGVTGEILEVWQRKEISGEWREEEERSFDSLRSLRMTILVG